MADVFSPEKRSAVMRSISSKGNKSTELRLIDLFKIMDIKGWRRNYKVKGHPDFVFMKQHVAIFVDGCFWHGHDCRVSIPVHNAEYWKQKRDHNMKHDKEITALFESRNWTVLRIWECELKKKNLLHTAQRISVILGLPK